MIEIPALIEHLRRRRAILVAGVGCGEVTRLPGWPDLCERLVGWLDEDEAKAHVRSLMAAARWGAALAFLRGRLQDEVILEVLKDAYPPQTEVPKVFSRLARAPWRGVITTALDDLWNRAVEGDVHHPTRVFGPQEAADLDEHRGRFLLRMFGGLGGQESFCLVPNDLRRCDPAGALVPFVQTLARRRSFVFVGFGPRDPDLLFLSQCLVAASADPAAHFLFYSGEQGLESESIGAELGLTVVPVTGGVEQVFRAVVGAWASVETETRPAEDDLDGWMDSLSRDPTDDEARKALFQIEDNLRREGRWARLVESLLGRAQYVRPGAEQIALLNEVGRIYAEELDQDDNAITSFQHLLTVEPDNLAALSALSKLLAKHERWGELAPVLGRAAALETDRRRLVDLLMQLASVQSVRLNDEGAALTTYERVLELNPSLVEAIDEVERRYRKQARWTDLARVLDERARRTADPAEAAKLREERATLLAQHVGDVETSVASLEALVESDPTNRAALRSLEAMYQKLGRIEDSVRVLDRLCDVAQSDAERLQLLRRLAVEWEKQPDGLDRAADALKQVLQIQPSDRDALSGLRRLYEAGRRWQALAETLTRQIAAAPGEDREQRRALYAAVGRVYDEELRDPVRAAEAYRAAEAQGDDSAATLGAIARLAEQQQQWQLSVEALDRLAAAAGDGPSRAQAFHRAATILADKLSDRAAAEDRYAKALEADADHVPALGALAALYRAQGQYLRAAKLFLEATGRTQNRLEKTRLLYETATLYQDQLGDEARAAELYAQVLAADPEHLPTAERAAALFTKRELWGALEPVLEMLAGKVEPGDVALAAQRQAHLGLTAQKLGDRDRAVQRYEKAYALSPDSLSVLAGFADLRMERGDWRQAATLYEEILAGHRAVLPEDEVIDVYMRLGRCEAGDGRKDAAIAWYEKAFAADGFHRPALEAIAGLHREKEDWAALVVDQRMLLALVDDEEKVRLYESTGDLYVEKLQKPLQAITAYQSALALAPDRRQVLHKVLELYTAARQWRPSASTLALLVELETTASVRAKYAYTAALIHRDELADPAGAVALFNRALDDSPNLIKAFDAIERILTGARDWKELGRNYRRMIKRLPVDGLTELRARLWHALGELSLKHLADREMALTALEVASSLERGNVRRHALLAELYVDAGPDHYDKAIQEHQQLIAAHPERLSSYRALGKLYGQIKAYDKLWCVAATLSFLRKAEPELQEFYEQHRPRELRLARRKFDDETWSLLVHPDEDRFVDAIFILMGHFVAGAAAHQHQAVGLKRKDRVDVARDERTPVRALRYLSHTLDLPTPDVFISDAEATGVAIVNLHERGVLTPAFLLGPKVAARPSEHEMVFELAKRMAFLRPERFLRCAVPNAGALDVALRAALAIAGAPIGSGPHNGQVDRMTDQLRRLVPKGVMEQLAVVGRKLLDARGEVIDMEAWMAASDLTASRVGFVLTNELPAVARVVTAEPEEASSLPTKQRLKDLLSFSVSEEYFAVRKFLGLELM